MDVVVRGITEGELVEALLAALGEFEDSMDGVTVADLVRVTGKSADIVRCGLRELKASGRLESVKVRREDLAGRVLRVPGYRLVDETKEEG